MLFYLIGLAIVFAILILLSALEDSWTVLIISSAMLVFIACILVLFFGEVYRSFFKGNAPFVRSNKKLLQKVIDTLEIREGARVYELGSGDARFLRMLAKKGDYSLVGVEYALLPYTLGKMMNFLYNTHIELRKGDFFNEDLRNADYVFTFLLVEEQKRIENKLREELPEGAYVISNTFSFQDWKPIDIVQIKAGKAGLNTIVYIYKK